MPTRTSYLRNMLEQVLDAYGTIEELKNRPGDLSTMRLELLRTRGIMQVIVNRIDARDYPSVDIGGLASQAARFLDDYYFEREMDTMELLYSDDPGRLAHLRAKILESFDKGLIEKVEDILSGL